MPRDSPATESGRWPLFLAVYALVPWTWPGYRLPRLVVVMVISCTSTVNAGLLVAGQHGLDSGDLCCGGFGQPLE